MKKNKLSPKYDCIVIGAGSAGLRAYKRLIQNNLKVLLVDDGPLGTTCARVGCMPSKSFLALPHVLDRLKKFNTFLRPKSKVLQGKDFFRTKSWMNETRRLRDFFTDDMIESTMRVAPDLRQDKALVLDAHHVLVGNEVVETRAIVLATGTRASWPDWTKQLMEQSKEASKFIHDEQTFFEQNDIDKNWAIIGAGPIGLELGGVLHSINHKSVIFSRTETTNLLSWPALQERFKTEYKDSVVYGEVKRVEFKRSKFEFKVGKRLFKVDRILLATGRKPNWASVFAIPEEYLNPEGHLDFNAKTLRIKKTNMFVAGDASQLSGILHESHLEGEHAAENVVRLLKRQKPLPMASKPSLKIVFSTPQVVTVGLTYKKLKAEKKTFTSFEFNFSRNGRSRTERQMNGQGVLFFDTKGKLLGAEILGGPAEHFGHLLALALSTGATRSTLREMVWYHPTAEEVFKHIPVK